MSICFAMIEKIATVIIERKALKKVNTATFYTSGGTKNGLPGENRTHNRNLGGSRYIHLTTGRFLYF